jgi:hypothetical protein
VAAAALQTATVGGTLPVWGSTAGQQGGTLHPLALGRAPAAAAVGTHGRMDSEHHSRTEGPAVAAAAVGGRSCKVQPRKPEPGAVAGRIRIHTRSRSRSAAGEAEALGCRAAAVGCRAAAVGCRAAEGHHRRGEGIRWRRARRCGGNPR